MPPQQAPPNGALRSGPQHETPPRNGRRREYDENPRSGRRGGDNRPQASPRGGNNYERWNREPEEPVDDRTGGKRDQEKDDDSRGGADWEALAARLPASDSEDAVHERNTLFRIMVN